MSTIIQKILLAATLIMVCGCSEPLQVTTVEAKNHRLEVSFTERAETVLRQDFPVSMPVNGKIDRIDLEVGDRVREGELLVSIDTIPARQEIEARAQGVSAGRARQRVTADTSVERLELVRTQKRLQALAAEQRRLEPATVAAKLALKNAKKERTRIENLVAGGALPAREQEQASLAVERAQAELSARQAESEVLRAQIAEAQTAVSSMRARLDRKLLEADSQAATIAESETRQAQAEYVLTKTQVQSPVSGLVLSRFERGPKELPAGAPLLTLGRLQDLEAECDVLSQDALLLHPGTPVFLDAGSAFPESLKGEVRMKEPQGFTKRSSLGVEQQRVKVRIGLLDPPKGLGSGYELWARFQLSEKTALSLPRSCFVRFGNEYRVWRVTNNKLELVSVEIGTKGNQHWEVTGAALSEGDPIVKNPSDKLLEGTEVRNTTS